MNPTPPPDWRALSDQEVVRQAAAGREAAYREIIRRYQRPVYSLIFRMVRNRELAEDLAQDTFIKMLNAINSYRPEYKFSSWIFKIANNAAIDQLRRRELDTLSLDGSPHAVDAETIEATTLQIGSEQESQLDEVSSKELGVQIERAIAQLRPEYRNCIILRHVDGRPYEEIAEILDLPLGTVKTYIHRARNELRVLLSDTREG